MACREEPVQDDDDVPVVRVVIVGGESSEKTAVLLKFVGVGVAEDGEAPPVVTWITAAHSEATEKGTRMITVDGTRVCVQLTVPRSMKTIGAAGMAIAMRKVDAALGVFSGTEESLRAAAVELIPAALHIPPERRRVIMLCNRHAGQPWNHHLFKQHESSPLPTTAPLGIHPIAVCTEAGPGFVWGTSTFDAILRAIVRAKFSSVCLTDALPRPWEIPSLVGLCQRFIRDNWASLPGGPSSLKSLPRDLWEHVVYPPLDFSRR
jgi:hypothetical protein